MLSHLPRMIMAVKSIIDSFFRTLLTNYLPIKIWLIKLSTRRHNESLSATQKLEEKEITATDMEKALAEWLAKWLRRYPIWVEGHLEFGNLCMKEKQAELAYASAHAVRKLTSETSVLHNLGTLLLARVYLRFRQFQNALEYFKKVDAARLTDQERHVLNEEQSTTHLLLEDYENAKMHLEKIGVQNLSPTNRMAYEYIQTKKDA